MDGIIDLHRSCHNKHHRSAQSIPTWICSFNINIFRLYSGIQGYTCQYNQPPTHGCSYNIVHGMEMFVFIQNSALLAYCAIRDEYVHIHFQTLKDTVVLEAIFNSLNFSCCGQITHYARSLTLTLENPTRAYHWLRNITK